MAALMLSDNQALAWTAPSFQSIGVTKEWRPLTSVERRLMILQRLQSIGVTKEWRREPAPQSLD